MKKLVGTAVNLVVFLCAVHAQNLHELDSLSRVLKGLTDDDKIKVYEKLAWDYRKSHPDSSVHYGQLIINHLKAKKDTFNLAKYYNFIGVAYYYKGDNLLSYDYYTQAHQFAEAVGDSLQYGHSMNNLGRFFLSQGEFLRSYDYCFRAYTVFKNLNDFDGMAYSLKRISELYLEQNLFEKSLETSERAMKIRQETNNIVAVAYTHIDLANIYAKMGDIPNAFTQYNLANEKAISIDDAIAIANTNLGIGQLLGTLKRDQEALEHILIAKEKAETINNLDLTNRVFINYGQILFQLNEFDKAASVFTEVVNNSKNSNQLTQLEKAHYYLSEIYRLKKQFEKSYNHIVLYHRLNKSLNNNEAKRAVDKLEFEVEIKRRESENTALKEKQDADQKTIKQQQIQNFILLGFLALIVIMATIAFRTNNKTKSINSKLKEMNVRIAKQQVEIRNQNNEINFKNEELIRHNSLLEETNREKDLLMNIVAHDLKSPINRIQGIIGLLLTTKLSKEQVEYVNMLSKVANSNLYFIRDLLDVNAVELNTRELRISTVDVNEVIEDSLIKFNALAGNKSISLVQKLPKQKALLDTDKSYVSRIIDNLISNAIKFSDPKTNVELNTYSVNDTVKLIVKDQGPGFSELDKMHLYKKFGRLSARPTSGESSHGLGLALVKILVEELHGYIELISEEEHGSEFTITLKNLLPYQV